MRIRLSRCMFALVLSATILAILTSCSSGQPELSGTTWISGLQADASISSLTPVQITIEFEADGEVTGLYAHLTYSGAYAVDGNHLTISDVRWQCMICQAEAPFLDAPEAFLDTIQRAESYSIDGDILTIHTTTEDLTFQAAE